MNGEREQACTKYLVDLVGVVTVSRSGNVGIQASSLMRSKRKRVEAANFPCCCGAAGREAAVTDRARWQSPDIARGGHIIKDLETLEVTSSFERLDQNPTLQKKRRRG
jgi:hypothetical protein